MNGDPLDRVAVEAEPCHPTGSPSPRSRGPFPVAGDGVWGGWLVGEEATDAELRLTDCSAEGKVVVLADPQGPMARHLGVGVGRAELFDDGLVVASVAPGEWLAFTPGPPAALVKQFAGLAASELVSVVDLTHGLAMARLSGTSAPSLLARLAGRAVGPGALADGQACAAPVAGARAVIVRDDLIGAELLAYGAASEPSGHPPADAPDAAPGLGDDGPPELVPSYLIAVDRSQGGALWDALLAAGAGDGLGVEGYLAYRRYHLDA